MKVAIALGSSLGDRRRRLELALRLLDARPGLTLLRASRWYRTPPLRGGTARNWFLNGAALFESELAPHEVLETCVALEERMGRRRGLHWGDRTLDLDVLLADALRCDEPGLRIPHPAIADRPFVLLPLIEAWPDAIDPVSGGRYADLPRDGTPRPVPIGVVAARRRAPYV